MVGIFGNKVMWHVHVDFFIKGHLGKSICVISLHSFPVPEHGKNQGKANCCPLDNYCIAIKVINAMDLFVSSHTQPGFQLAN